MDSAGCAGNASRVLYTLGALARHCTRCRLFDDEKIKWPETAAAESNVPYSGDQVAQIAERLATFEGDATTPLLNFTKNDMLAGGRALGPSLQVQSRESLPGKAKMLPQGEFQRRHSVISSTLVAARSLPTSVRHY